MTTLGDAMCDFSAASLKATHSHLLGCNSQPCTRNTTGGNNLPEASTNSSLLVVLPVFSDTDLGAYGAALLASRAPQMLLNGKLDIAGFHGSWGQIHLLDLSSDPEPSARRMNVLFVGQGNRSDSNNKGFCGLVGSALDSGLRGHYDHIVIATSDFTGAPINGQLIGAVARCRLAVTIVEDQADLIVRRMTLIVHPEQLSPLCRGIEIAGPLCSNCDHPRAGTLKIPRV
jgi:hypothetical protein